MIRERGIRKHYLCYGRADFIANHEDVIAEWSELGLTAVIVGLEASTNVELDSMNKQTTVDLNHKAIDVLRRHRIDTYGSLIPNPDYSPEDWNRLQKFIDDTGLYYVNISPLTPLPGTSEFKEYEEKLTVERTAHGLWDLSHCVIPTRMPLKKFYRALLKDLWAHRAEYPPGQPDYAAHPATRMVTQVRQALDRCRLHLLSIHLRSPAS